MREVWKRGGRDEEVWERGEKDEEVWERGWEGVEDGGMGKCGKGEG